MYHIVNKFENLTEAFDFIREIDKKPNIEDSKLIIKRTGRRTVKIFVAFTITKEK